MDIHLRDLVGAEEVLARIFQARPAQAKTTFRIAQLKRAITPGFEDYFPARLNLLKEHARLDPERPGHYEFILVDEDGEIALDDEGNKQRDPDAIQAFQDAHKDLLNEEVEIAAKPLTLPIIDGIGLEPALSVEEMGTIFWLIKE